jgi:hypothetical protein
MHEFGAYCDIRLLCPAMFLIAKNFGVWGLVVGSNPPKLSFGSSHPLLRRRTTGPMGPILALKKWDNRVADIGCLAQQDRVDLFPWQSFSSELVSVLLRTWSAFCRYPICLLRGRFCSLGCACKIVTDHHANDASIHARRFQEKFRIRSQVDVIFTEKGVQQHCHRHHDKCSYNHQPENSSHCLRDSNLPNRFHGFGRPYRSRKQIRTRESRN